MPLYLGTHRIDKLSGPTAVRILEPVSSSHSPILLFGDTHGSIETLCDDELSIYDPAFIQMFNDVGTELRPTLIAFEYFHYNWTRELAMKRPSQARQYIPHFAKPMFGVDPREQEPLHHFGIQFAPCLFREAKMQSWFTQYCPYDNIEWIFADIRHTLSQTTFTYPYFYEGLLTFILSHLYKNDIDHQAKFFIDRVHRIADYFGLSADNILHDVFEGVMAGILYRDTLLHHITRNHSYIKKELDRMDNRSQWENDISVYYQYNIYVDAPPSLEDLIMARVYLEGLERRLTIMLHGDPVRLWTDVPDYVSDQALCTGAMIMDTYLLLRFCNRGYIPSIGMMYVGSAHTKGITYFLTQITRSHVLTYELDQETRCLDFTDVDIVV